MNLSEKIMECRDGIYHNPYQGPDKRVVFVCSMGILRSATAARLYAHKYNTRSCGTWEDALVPLTPELIAWADEIVFVNRENFLSAKDKFTLDVLEELPVLIVLNIPDKYPHMHPKLVEEFIKQYEPI